MPPKLIDQSNQDLPQAQTFTKRIKKGKRQAGENV